jgi:TM2 domain-containing membrane protein YozV
MKFFFLIIMSSFFCFAEPQYTIKKEKELGPSLDSIKIQNVNVQKKKLLPAGVLSAIVPGAGQFYTANYVKSGMYFSTEVILGLVSYNRYVLGKDFSKTSMIMHDSLARSLVRIGIEYDTLKSKMKDSIALDSLGRSKHSDTLKYQMRSDYSEFLEKENRYFMNQIISLMAGLYYWNFLDALKNTKFFKNDDVKNPATAGWLSAIPGLGLGQFYNGELSKAGFVFTMQMTMAYMIFNYSGLMRVCEDHLTQINSLTAKEKQDPAWTDLKTSWDSKRSDAFKNRNMWLWYSIGFYLYGIFDAVVDAHLHDSAIKMKLEPDLEPEKQKIGLKMNVPF